MCLFLSCYFHFFRSTFFTALRKIPLVTFVQCHILTPPIRIPGNRPYPLFQSLSKSVRWNALIKIPEQGLQFVIHVFPGSIRIQEDLSCSILVFIYNYTRMEI